MRLNLPHLVKPLKHSHGHKQFALFCSLVSPPRLLPVKTDVEEGFPGTPSCLATDGAAISLKLSKIPITQKTTAFQKPIYLNRNARFVFLAFGLLTTATAAIGSTLPTKNRKFLRLHWFRRTNDLKPQENYDFLKFFKQKMFLFSSNVSDRGIRAGGKGPGCAGLAQLPKASNIVQVVPGH